MLLEISKSNRSNRQEVVATDSGWSSTVRVRETYHQTVFGNIIWNKKITIKKVYFYNS